MPAQSELFEPAQVIEFIHRRDHRVALGFGAGVPDSFPEETIRNINCRFHASKI